MAVIVHNVLWKRRHSIGDDTANQPGAGWGGVSQMWGGALRTAAFRTKAHCWAQDTALGQGLARNVPWAVVMGFGPTVTLRQIAWH